MSQPRTNPLLEILGLFGEITLFRKGPEHLPSSALLLLATIVGYAVLALGVLALLPPLPDDAAVSSGIIIHILVTAGACFLLLRLAGKPERFLQSLTALFGMQLVLTPLLVPTAWAFLTYAKDPSWFMVAASLRMLVEIWAMVVQVRILRSATEWPVFTCVMVAISLDLLTAFAVLTLVPGASSTPT